jgi:hypothetical protein
MERPHKSVIFIDTPLQNFNFLPVNIPPSSIHIDLCKCLPSLMFPEVSGEPKGDDHCSCYISLEEIFRVIDTAAEGPDSRIKLIGTVSSACLGLVTSFQDVTKATAGGSYVTTKINDVPER